MTAIPQILAALQAAGVPIRLDSRSTYQGCIGSVDNYPRPLKLYAWQVTDNGRATGIVRPADERRIQAIASGTQTIHASDDPETVVLGWCDEYTPEPIIVAFNPYGVSRRVTEKVDSKLAAGASSARASDSQQFRQALLDEALANGIAVGRNQHGEYVVAMRPQRFLDYLNNYKATYHPSATPPVVQQTTGRSMLDLVAEAEVEEAAPVDAVDVELPTTFDPASIADGRERVAREIAIRRGQAQFRNQLLRAYGCCAMSGCTVVPALEAAHIVPYQGPGTNHLANGLLLRADLHTLFDLGLLAVDHETLAIVVSSDLNGTEYETLRGQSLNLGHRLAFPSRAALQEHRRLAGI